MSSPFPSTPDTRYANSGGVSIAYQVVGEGPIDVVMVLVSSVVRDLSVGSGLEFTDRGRHTLKGVPGEWLAYGLTR